MTKNTKTLLYILGGVVTSTVLVYGYSLLKKKKDIKTFNPDSDFQDDLDEIGTENNQASTDEVVSGQAVPSRESFPLKIAMYGKNVHVMQQALKKLGYYSGQIDGKFGQLTDDALDKGGSRYNGSFCGNRFVGGCEVTRSRFSNLMSDAKNKGFDENLAVVEAEKMYL